MRKVVHGMRHKKRMETLGQGKETSRRAEAGRGSRGRGGKKGHDEWRSCHE